MWKMGRAVMLAAFLSFSLGGCAALSGIGGSLFSFLGDAGVGALKEKVRARAEHETEAKIMFRNMVAVMRRKAEDLADRGEYDKAFAVYDYMFQRHQDLKPEFMVTKGIEAIRARRLSRQQHELEIERIRAGVKVTPAPIVPVEIAPLTPAPPEPEPAL